MSKCCCCCYEPKKEPAFVRPTGGKKKPKKPKVSFNMIVLSDTPAYLWSIHRTDVVDLSILVKNHKEVAMTSYGVIPMIEVEKE